MLRKGVYPYEFMNDLEMINETRLPEKEESYSKLTMEDIPETDYMHGKWVCKDLK